MKDAKSRAEAISSAVQAEDIPTNSATAQTDPFEYLFEARELFLATEIQKWKDVASCLQQGTITLKAHQEELKRIREQGTQTITGYIEHMDREKHKREKQRKKIENLEENVQILKTDKEEMFSLAQQVMACRPPTHSYALFLHEQYIFFYLESIRHEVNHEIKDPIQFYRILRIHDVLNQHLMCELYMHDYFLSNYQTFNPIPFVGDIQLRAFTSYTINQVKWKKAFDTF